MRQRHQLYAPSFGTLEQSYSLLCLFFIVGHKDTNKIVCIDESSGFFIFAYCVCDSGFYHGFSFFLDGTGGFYISNKIPDSGFLFAYKYPVSPFFDKNLVRWFYVVPGQ
ncbi:MAG: hypothetical protein LBG98_02150 [Puniceicoccales bacterium]|nr:hypothetical protein [Puniceicoccales bacterium]